MAQQGGRSAGGENSSQGGRGAATKASPAAVERYLKGVDYPASKQDLVDHAQDQDAPDDVMHVIEQMADRTYNSPVDVSKEVGQIE